MTIDDFLQHCLRKPGTAEHFPFDNDTLVIKVAGKMFALSSINDWESGNPSVNVKSNPEYAIELREQYQGITPGYHMNKTHWNTVKINEDVPDRVVFKLIDDSYELVVSKLPKSVRESLRR